MNEETKRQIRQHQKIGFWKDFWVVLLLFFFCFLPILGSVIAYAPEYLWLAWIAILPVLAAIGYLIWRGERFKKIISDQVQKYQCNLDSDSKKILWGVYLSRNWIIVSGRFAVCRNNIKHSAQKEDFSQRNHTIKITTRDNQTYRFSVSYRDYEKRYKIKKWLKNARL